MGRHSTVQQGASRQGCGGVGLGLGGVFREIQVAREEQQDVKRKKGCREEELKKQKDV